jgi:hypothetical protein
MRKHYLLILTDDIERNERLVEEIRRYRIVNDIKISMLYVVRNIHWASYLTTSYKNCFKGMYNEGVTTLQKIGKQLKINSKDRMIKIGCMEMESACFAKKIHADKIIVDTDDLFQTDSFKNVLQKTLAYSLGFLQKHYGKRKHSLAIQ